MTAPPLITSHSKSRWLLIAAITVASAITVLFFFNPAQHGFYPRCFLRSVTGIECAGCGGLRATHQMLNGNWSAAFQLNPLLFLAAPIAALFLLNSVAVALFGRKLFHRTTAQFLLWTLLASTVIFTVCRNVQDG